MWALSCCTSATRKRAWLVTFSAPLRGVLEMLNTSPTGRPFGGESFVFGDEVGDGVGVPNRAWEGAVLRAHGLKPVRTKTGALTLEARTAFQRIDLTFHDLRHEAGSRLLEAGMPLHEVSAMLGHANISMTSRYLNAKVVGLLSSMERIDRERSFARRCKRRRA